MQPSPEDHPPTHWITERVASLVWRVTPKCREVARLTSEGRDRALPLGTRLRLRVHRSFCLWCERYAQQLDLLHTAAERFPEHLDEAGGESLPADAKARLKRAMRQ
jgi:hypothetical protein